MTKEIKVFMIHRWDMAGLQSKIFEMLKRVDDVKFIDNSYTTLRPAEKDEFIQDYACGMMMDSDIVIVLPDSESNYDEEGDEYLSDLSHNFGDLRGMAHDAVYTTELKTVMFDSCNKVPVLVLGYNKKSAEYLANVLKHPRGIDRREYNSDRFFSLGLDEVSTEKDLSDVILNIIRKKAQDT